MTDAPLWLCPDLVFDGQALQGEGGSAGEVGKDRLAGVVLELAVEHGPGAAAEGGEGGGQAA